MGLAVTKTLTLKTSQRARNVGADLQMKVASLDACGRLGRVKRENDGTGLYDVTAAANSDPPGIRNTIYALDHDVLRATIQVTAPYHTPGAV